MKSPFKSKTLWVNIIGILAMLGQSQFGFVVAAEDQAVALGAINLILRLITREQIDWSTPINNIRGSARRYLVASMLCFSLAGLVALPLLSGCSMAGRIANDDIAAQLVVRAAAGRVLDQRPDWTEATYRITGELIELVRSEPHVSLAGLEEAVIDRVNWNELTPEDQAILQVLISAARTDLEVALEKRGVSEPGETKIAMQRVLGWINQSAEIRRAVHAG